MALREQISASLKDAMRNKDAARLMTLRLMNAAIKDRDIEVRAEGKDEGVDDPTILAIMGKMVKQRLESAKAFDDGDRPEMAAKERAEITVIEEFLPRQLNADEVSAAIEAAISETGAESIRDMGKVMGALKAQYTGQLDFGAAGALIKGKLS